MSNLRRQAETVPFGLTFTRPLPAFRGGEDPAMRAVLDPVSQIAMVDGQPLYEMETEVQSTSTNPDGKDIIAVDTDPLYDSRPGER